MDLTYFGHSAFQVKTDRTTLLFDPFITGNRHAEGRVDVDALEPDVILLTHAHSDHWGDTVRIARRTGALVVANFEITQYLNKKHGYDHVHPMNVGGSWSFSWGTVRQTPARHSSSFPDGTYGGLANGYLVTIGDTCLYNLGDTALFSEMDWIGEANNIDVALLPIGDNFTMGPVDAVRAALMLRPALSIPIHYGTFPLIEVDVDEWVGLMSESGLKARVVAPGDTISL